MEKKISLQHAQILELTQTIESLKKTYFSQLHIGVDKNKEELEKLMAMLSRQGGSISGKEARLARLEQDIEELKLSLKSQMEERVQMKS